MTFSNGAANILVTLVLLGWPLVVFAMFLMLRARTAALWSLLVGFLFLPEGAFLFAGLPEYTKQSATGLAVLLAALILDGGKPLRIRPRSIDLAIVMWCFGRIATSVSNGLGVYDGFSQLFLELSRWGIPYWVGRAYFSDSEGLRELARGIVIGGLLYVPLCLWEVRFSPQLHTKLYGFLATPFYMVLRYDGYRPMVFMQTSLMVAMWMSTATVLCAWLGISGAVKRIAGVPTVWWIAPLFVTTLLCKAMGAVTLMIVGIGVLLVARTAGTALPLVIVATLAGAYPVLRYSGLMSNERILSAASVVYDDERLESLGIRLTSEEMFIDHSRERALLGWGGWGRNMVYLEDGQRSVPDGLWVIALSSAGWLALGSLAAMFLAPVVQLLRRFRAPRWPRADTAPFAGMAVLVLLYWVDCLSNAMVNSVLVAAIAGTNGWFATPPKRVAAVAVPVSAAPAELAPRAESRPAKLGLGRGLSNRRRGPPT